MGIQTKVVRPAVVMSQSRKFSWHPIPPPIQLSVHDVAVSPRGNPSSEVWLIDENKKIWSMYSVGGATQIKQAGSGFSRLAVALDGETVWAISVTGGLWKRNNAGQWFEVKTSGKITSSLEDVTVDGQGYVWMTGQDGTIWTTPDGTSLEERTVVIPFKRLAANANNAMWGISFNGSLWTLDFETRSWYVTSGMSMDDVSVSFEGVVWLLDDNGRVWTTTDGQTISPNPGEGFRSLSIGEHGLVWGAKTDGSLWAWFADLDPEPKPGGGGGGTGTGPPPPPPPPVKPTISCSVSGSGTGSVFTITGSGFLVNNPVRIRVTRIGPDQFYDVSFDTSSNSTGSITYSQPIPCLSGLSFNFSATDGRPNPSDFTGVLWSNTVTSSCP